MPTNLVLLVLGDCDESEIDSFEFYAGEKRQLKLQVRDENNDQKVAIPATATKSLRLAATPNDLLVLDADITVDSNDASIFTVELSPAMTQVMITGTIQFTFATALRTRVATLEYGLKRLRLMTE